MVPFRRGGISGLSCREALNHLGPWKAESEPVHVSDEALKYRELAARSDAYTVCYQFFATGKATVPYLSKMSDTPIDEMCLSVRSSNGLLRAGANTFGKVKETMEQENGLRTIRNLGVNS
mgnify:CR=1 FL=1